MSSFHRPAVLAFDVNETVLDITSLEPFFLKHFGRRDAMREWYAQLILYSQAMTLAGAYAPLPALATGVLRMLGAIHGFSVGDDAAAGLAAAIKAMPAHADVRPALTRLRAAGFHLVTLTNSAPNPEMSPLARAGLDDLFERQFSVDAVKRFKPAPDTYAAVAQGLHRPPSDICLVAAHAWDTLGAKRFGCAAALVLRPGNAPIPCADVPQPDMIVPDFTALADRLCAMPIG